MLCTFFKRVVNSNTCCDSNRRNKIIDELPKDESIPILNRSNEDAFVWTMSSSDTNTKAKEATNNTLSSTPTAEDSSSTSSISTQHVSVSLPDALRIDPSQDFLIDINRLELGREIGRGQFSCVYEGSYDGKRVAVKKQVLDDDKTIGKYLHQELAVLKNVTHPNL